MRIAHLIMVHKNPAQVERLLHALAHEDADCYLHLDLNVDAAPFAYLAALPRVQFVPARVAVRWASFRFTEAILAGLRAVLASGQPYDFVNLLSGQDYPLRSAEVVHRFFGRYVGCSFLSFEPEGSAWWRHAIRRVEQYHTTYYQFRGQYRVQAVVNALLPKRRFPLPYTLYGGPDGSWWTMGLDCAAYLVAFMAAHPEVARFARFTWGSDEFLLATILLNSPLKDRIVNDNYRYIDWSGGGANPKVLTVADAPALAQSAKLFARKFDTETDGEILDAVDHIRAHPSTEIPV